MHETPGVQIWTAPILFIFLSHSFAPFHTEHISYILSTSFNNQFTTAEDPLASTMAKINLVLAALFCFLALNSAAEPQVNDFSTGDLSESVPTFNPLIELPQADQETTVIPKQPESTESEEDLTSVLFRPEDDRLNGRQGKRLRHRHSHHHFKTEELSFGNDMILSSHDKGSDDGEEEKQERWVKFHHHGEHELGNSDGSDMMEIVSENDDVKRPDHHRHSHHGFEREGDDEREDHRRHHHHRFERSDDEKRVGRRQRFERNEDEERDGHHHHHHGHRHHHHDEEDQDEEGGVVMKMRKFLMSRF